MKQNEMKQMEVGKSGLTVSRISMGTLPMGGESVWGDCDNQESIRTIHASRACGINFFDTAPAYGFGRSEEVLGAAMEGHRSDYIISTKCGLRWDTSDGAEIYRRDGYTIRCNLTGKSIREELEQSLRRLKTDYIDIYFTHWQHSETLGNYDVPVSETMGTLLELKREGKIRAIGASNVNLEQIREYLKEGTLDIIQNRFSMLDQESYRQLNEECQKHQITFHAYSPFERGLLTGAVDMNFCVKPGDARSRILWYQPERRKKVLCMLASWEDLWKKYKCSPAALNLAWMLAQAPNVNVDAGSRKAKNMEMNAAGGSITLEAEDLNRMNQDITLLHRQYQTQGNQEHL